MAIGVEKKHFRVTKILESLMKAVQRDLDNSQLKVDVLSNLIDVKEKLDNDGKKESNG